MLTMTSLGVRDRYTFGELSRAVVWSNMPTFEDEHFYRLLGINGEIDLMDALTSLAAQLH